MTLSNGECCAKVLNIGIDNILIKGSHTQLLLTYPKTIAFHLPCPRTPPIPSFFTIILTISNLIYTSHSTEYTRTKIYSYSLLFCSLYRHGSQWYGSDYQKPIKAHNRKVCPACLPSSQPLWLRTRLWTSCNNNYRLQQTSRWSQLQSRNFDLFFGSDRSLVRHSFFVSVYSFICICDICQFLTHSLSSSCNQVVFKQTSSGGKVRQKSLSHGVSLL